VLPERCLALCREADLLLHCGDVVSLACWNELRGLGPPLAGVRGNMDEEALQELLPERTVVEVADVRIGMVHDPGALKATRFSGRAAAA
jgi:predicted phosphodiesterase